MVTNRELLLIFFFVRSFHRFEEVLAQRRANVSPRYLPTAIIKRNDVTVYMHVKVIIRCRAVVFGNHTLLVF